MVHFATHVENNMGSEVEEKNVFKWTAFMIDHISAYKWQMAFIGLDFEAEKPRINTELRVMMAEM